MLLKRTSAMKRTTEETFKKLDHTLIDSTIAPINKRVGAVIGKKGSRTKY